MSSLVIKRVATNRDKRQFLQLPWVLYKGDPNWIPPLRSNQKEMVGYSYHPFYDRNRIQTFLAYRNGEACGRIAAILNLGHIMRYRERRGFFGFFECIDDQEVANALLDAVREWFADQGIYSLRGPTNPSQNYELGLLIEGFETPPAFMMTYNPPYYARLLEGYGFRKTQDLYAFWGHVDMLPKVSEKLAPLAEQIIDYYKVHLRSLDTSRFLEDVEAFLSIYNRSLVNTWGFVAMSKAEVQHVARGLRHLIIPELTVGAEIDGKLIGASFGFPDYNPRIKQINGRLFPFGFLRLLSRKRDFRLIRLISTNVMPEYQRMGIGLTLMHGLVPKVLNYGIEEAEFSWVLESNSLSRGSLEKGGAKRTKTYRLYDLDGAKEVRTQVAVTAGYAKAKDGASMEIREVRGRRDLNEFCSVPERIYADDPQWAPPLLVEVKEFLNPRKHPFYLHGAATQFVARRGGVPLGRILVSDDPRYNQHHGTNTGCFGMFECVDDREMAHGLLEAAGTWLRARGRSSIIGPIDYSTNYPCGLLVEGFETPPRIMMNHHRPYYAGLLESWGLNKVKDLWAWWFLDPNDMLTKWRGRGERLLRHGRITVRPFRTDDFEAEARRCEALYNEAMCDNWGAVKFTEAEFRYMAKRLAQLAVRDLVLLAEMDGKAVGFSVTLPDYNEAIGPLGGRLTNYGLPINLLRLARRRRHIRTARMAVMVVLKGYRRRGIAELLILSTLEYGRNVAGYTAAELSWTLEDNDLVNRTIQAVGAQHYKTYRVYGKSLGEG